MVPTICQYQVTVNDDIVYEPDNRKHPEASFRIKWVCKKQTHTDLSGNLEISHLRHALTIPLNHHVFCCREFIAPTLLDSEMKAPGWGV